MSHKTTAFYQGKQVIEYNFEAEEVSSDGGLLLLKAIERRQGLIKQFAPIDLCHSPSLSIANQEHL